MKKIIGIMVIGFFILSSICSADIEKHRTIYGDYKKTTYPDGRIVEECIGDETVCLEEHYEEYDFDGIWNYENNEGYYPVDVVDRDEESVEYYLLPNTVTYTNHATWLQACQGGSGN